MGSVGSRSRSLSLKIENQFPVSNFNFKFFAFKLRKKADYEKKYLKIAFMASLKKVKLTAVKKRRNIFLREVTRIFCFISACFVSLCSVREVICVLD